MVFIKAGLTNVDLLRERRQTGRKMQACKTPQCRLARKIQARRAKHATETRRKLYVYRMYTDVGDDDDRKGKRKR